MARLSYSCHTKVTIYLSIYSYQKHIIFESYTYACTHIRVYTPLTKPCTIYTHIIEDTKRIDIIYISMSMS